MTVWSLISKFLIFFNGYEKINQCLQRTTAWSQPWLPGDFVSMKKCWICMNKAWISSIVRVDSLREHPFFSAFIHPPRRPTTGNTSMARIPKQEVQFYLSMGMQWSEDTSDKWKLTPVLIKREQVCQERKCLICEKILREMEKSTFWYE